MNKASYVYVVYIATTPEKLWQALTSPDFSQKYWFGRRATSDWKAGSKVHYWRDAAQQELDFCGTILRSEPHKVLSYTFGEGEGSGCSSLAGEPPSRVTYELTQLGELVRLSMTHDELVEGGKVIGGISRGWPAILSGLKSLLETGQAMSLDHDKFAASHQH